jgi:hypothetical protein
LLQVVVEKTDHKLAGISAGLILISLCLGLGHLTAGHNWGGDFAQYIMQAQSLVDGTVPEFMAANRITIEESYFPLGPVAYPWGLPLLLAPLYALWGVNLLGFKLVGVAAWLGVLLLLARYARVRHGRSGFALLAVLALNPFLLGYLNQVASDVPFMLASTAAIMLMPGWSGPEITARRGVALGLVMAAASLLRSNGILLVIPLMFAQFIHGLESGRFRSGLRAGWTWEYAWPWLTFTLVYGAVTAWLPEGGSSHLGHFSLVTVQTIRDNLVYYFKLPLALYEGVSGRQAICLLTYPLCAVGMLARVRRDRPTLLYIAATLGIYLLWPDSMQGLRFLFPLLPFYLSFTTSGFQTLTDRLAPGLRRVALGVGWGLTVYVVGALMATSVDRVVANQRQGRTAPEGPYTEVSRALFDEVRRVTKPDDHVVFFKPRVMRFLTGRPSTLPRSLNHLRPGTYLVLYRGDDGSVGPISEAAIEAADRVQQLHRVSNSVRYGIYYCDEADVRVQGANQP